MVTHRKIPKDVFIHSNINSYKIVMEIKELFKEQVTLNFFDKYDGNIYSNMETDFLKN